ncbi:DUF4394 domain-containing protein [Hymenobacter sp. M29]|uniref:DUF4394 domain-containing protein n=1 Tax=Hymenobacter mellowenesis TaxID=3063995 RepID=A0ABT9A853_9BACT|nr:DUF4394 domain-containing protein [Hymenobacter sp. M29]
MYARLHSRWPAGRDWARLLVTVLLVALFFVPGRAQVVVYGLGTLTRTLQPGDPLYAPGAPAGSQGLAGFDVASGRPRFQVILVSGLTGSQRLVAIDYRASTGQLYALGYDTGASTANAQLYTLNVATGAATPVSAAPITLALGGATERIGFDFNPVADLARVVSTNDQNYRLSPSTGLVVGTDGPLAYGASDPNAALNPRVGGIAYSNAYPGSTSSTLYDIDVRPDPSAPFGILSAQIPPNSGTLNTLGQVRLESYGILPDALINPDIFYNGTTNVGLLLELTPPGTDPSRPSYGYSSSNLYDLNLTSNPGDATNKRNLVPALYAFPFNVLDIAIAPTPTISSLAPNYAQVGTNGLTLTVNGAGFAPGSQVQYNGNVRNTTYVSASQLTATLTAADLAIIGTYPVTVTNPDSPNTQGTPSAPAVFTVGSVPPACGTPASLMASNVTSTSATVRFTGTNTASSYTLTTVPATSTQTLAGTATTASLSGLLPGTSYTVSIVSNCSTGATSGAGTLTFSTTAANPLPVLRQGSTVIPNGGTFAGFAATGQGATSAPVTFSISNTSATEFLTLGAFTFSGPFALSSVAPVSVVPGGTANFGVTFTPSATGANTGSLRIANNSQADNPYVLNLSGQGVLATAPAALARLATVYPNPAHGVATLLLPKALRGTLATPVAVIDNLGRTVLTRTLAAGAAETLELPLAGLAPGIYAVVAHTAVGLVARRLVVQ